MRDERLGAEERTMVVEPRDAVAPSCQKGIAGEPFTVCRDLLPSVSRTFALTIGVLPGQLRRPVTVAYILCRMAETLEDATTSDPARRVEGLETLAGVLADRRADSAALSAALEPFVGLACRDESGMRLLQTRRPVFDAYTRLEAADRLILSRWIQALATGMAAFVDRERRRSDQAAPVGTVRHILATRDELRAYAWYVAGTVGHLLTELFELRFYRGGWPGDRLHGLASPFGLGLQFTNILQDLADDRRRGWSYVPEDLARAEGTAIERLDAPEEREAAMRVVAHLVREASVYLDRAMEYTELLPRGAPRVRLFCVWPVFFAVRTLARIWGDESVVTGGAKVRITREEVRSVIGSTTALCLTNAGLDRLYQAEKRRLRRRMASQPIPAA